MAALAALGLPERVARDLLAPDFAGRIGFADFELKNNGANIRRIRARIEAVGAAKAAPDETIQGERAWLEVSQADNRVRLFFPGKPDAETCERLKGCGFRWAPSIGCWQAYVNRRSIEAGRREAGAGLAADGCTDPDDEHRDCETACGLVGCDPKARRIAGCCA